MQGDEERVDTDWLVIGDVDGAVFAKVLNHIASVNFALFVAGAARDIPWLAIPSTRTS